MVGVGLDAAFEHIVDAEIATDSSYVRRFSFVNFRGIPGDDKQIFGVRQVRYDILGDPVDKAIPLRVASNVVEWQDGDGSPFRKGRN